MSITSTLLKVGGTLAIAHLLSRIKTGDLEKLSSMSVDDLKGYLKSYGLDRADRAFDTVGLRRTATLTSSTSLVLAGFVAGATVGAGVLFFAYTERGKTLRRRVVDVFRRDEDERDQANEPAAAAPVDRPAAAAPVDEPAAAHDAGGNTAAKVQHPVEMVSE